MAKAAVEIVVVGAGPSGLFASVELARHGVSVRLVEREPQPHHQARATALQPGTLEILAAAGLVERVLDASMHLRYARVFDTRLETIGEMCFAGAGCQWEFQCSLPQWRTEQLLTERLIELGGAVERGTRVVSLEPRDGSVLAKLERMHGEPETLEAHWVIGAGGAHSLTRSSMAEELGGDTYPGTAIAADVRVSCELSRDGNALILGPQGYVLLGPLPDDRWITFVGDLEKREIEELSERSARDAVPVAIEHRLGSAIRVDDVGWASAFQMHKRLVSRMAEERCFLLGDAGHLSSPFGGEGLNSGIQDGHNLAWKLALELRGRGRPPLLESFATERLAADRHVLEVSDQIHAFAHGGVESARAGKRAGPPTRDLLAAMVRSRTMLDVSYAGSPIVGQYVARGDYDHRPPEPGDRYPDRVRLTGTRHRLLLFGTADDAAVAALRDRWHDLVEIESAPGDPSGGGLVDGGAVLVRPDGHIGFRAAPADAAGVKALDAHLGSYLRPA